MKKEKGILDKRVTFEWIIFIIIVGMIVVLIVNDDGSSSNSNTNDMVCYEDEDGRIVCDEYYNPANDREYEIRTGYDG